jgi:transposase-like protein
MSCPFCDSAEVELISPFAGQIITSQYRCKACSSYFEALREDFEDRHLPEAQSRSASDG